jgi:hypothetical protein
LLSTPGFQDFTIMHETARHAIHSCEILSVSVETVEAMQRQVIDLLATHKGESSSRAEASNQIRLQDACGPGFSARDRAGDEWEPVSMAGSICFAAVPWPAMQSRSALLARSLWQEALQASHPPSQSARRTSATRPYKPRQPQHRRSSNALEGWDILKEASPRKLQGVTG